MNRPWRGLAPAAGFGQRVGINSPAPLTRSGCAFAASPTRGLLRYRPKEVRNGVVDRFSDALGRFGYRAGVSARFGARFRSDSGRYRSPASQVEGDGGHHHLGLGLGQSDIAD